MPIPYIENLHEIKDLVTGITFACTAKDVSFPYDWKTAIVPTPFGHGGIDAHSGQNDWLSPRTVTVTLVHRYLPGETFKTVSNALEKVIGQGNPIQLTTQEEDGATWLWMGLRVQKYDKKYSAGQFGYHAEYSITFIAPEPQQRALFEPGTLLLDNGLYLDASPPFYLDTDPDNFLLTGTSASHAINNSTGISPDFAPIVTLQGPITGPITATYLDASGATLFSWTYTRSIVSGEIVHVDAGQQDVTSTTSGSVYSSFAPPNNTDLWGIIRPGNSTFRLAYAAASSPAHATISWGPRK